MNFNTPKPDKQPGEKVVNGCFLIIAYGIIITGIGLCLAGLFFIYHERFLQGNILIFYPDLVQNAKVGDLIDSPNDFKNKFIRLNGKITKKVSLSNSGDFNDGTGEIRVMSMIFCKLLLTYYNGTSFLN